MTPKITNLFRIKSFILVIFSFTFIALNAQSPKKMVKTGNEFFATQNYQDAIDQYSKAIELEVDYVDDILLIGFEINKGILKNTKNE